MGVIGYAPSYYAYSLQRLSYLHKIHYRGGGMMTPFFLPFYATMIVEVVSKKIAEGEEVRHGKTVEDDIIYTYL